MNDWEERLRRLERGVHLLRERVKDVEIKAARAAGASIIRPPQAVGPPVHFDCTYAAWPTTLTWEFTGSSPSTPLPAGVDASRTVTKHPNLNDVLTSIFGGGFPDPCRGWIGDADEYPGVGNSSYRYVTFEPDYSTVGYARLDAGTYYLHQVSVRYTMDCWHKTMAATITSLFSASRTVSVHR